MATFSFARFKTFAAKHYAEYGRNYKFAIIALIALELFVRLLTKWWADAENIVSLREVLYFIAYTFMVSNCTAWSLGGLHCKNDIIDMTLPVNAIERYSFIWLNSFLLGVVTVAILLSSDGDRMLTNFSYLIPLHALVLAVACGGSKRGYTWVVLGFFAVLLGFSSLFEQIDVFLSYGIGKFFSLLPNDNAVYMSNIYENAEGHLVYRWDILFHIADWVHIVYNCIIVLMLYAAAYLKLRERRL